MLFWSIATIIILAMVWAMVDPGPFDIYWRKRPMSHRIEVFLTYILIGIISVVGYIFVFSTIIRGMAS